MMSSYFISKLRSLDEMIADIARWSTKNNNGLSYKARAIVSELLCEATNTSNSEMKEMMNGNNNAISGSEVSATGLILVNKKVSATEKSNFLAKLAEFDYCNEH